MHFASWDLASMGTVVLYTVSFLAAVVSGLLPFVINIEAYLIAVAALAHASTGPMVGVVTAGDMSAKFILYLTGMGTLKLKFIRREKMEKAAAAFEKHRTRSMGVVALSSLTGLPPFYAVTLFAGALKLPLVQFMLVGTTGRIIRFSAVYLAPRLFHLAK